jgi:hypothetical protein
MSDVRNKFQTVHSIRLVNQKDGEKILDDYVALEVAVKDKEIADLKWKLVAQDHYVQGTESIQEQLTARNKELKESRIENNKLKGVLQQAWAKLGMGSSEDPIISVVYRMLTDLLYPEDTSNTK